MTGTSMPSASPSALANASTAWSSRGADVVVDDARATYTDGMLRVEIPLASPDETVRHVPIEP